ncbi:LysM repeat protein [Anaerotaenia torta]|uniref:LysM peptidoglycan-binding domain-containing protein n=1 Tax=Anaerotaenia torta TaxID=433293 RepID=UPI003D1D7F34
MSYAVWFKRNRTIYKLPVNPEEIEISSALAVEKYEVLRQGQIAVPVNMELAEYSFETELPCTAYHYVTTSNEFKDAEFYLSRFEKWRNKLEAVQFIAARLEDGPGLIESINTMVLIEELSIVEKAGEEGDKYVKFKLLEYKNYSKKPADEIIYTRSAVSGTSKAKKSKKVITEAVTPKSTGYYVVKAGDSLWSIAKKQYGDGSKCNIIYNANKDKIKNPSLINVGWKLKIPAESEFSKYSAPLPTEKKETKAERVKTNTTQTAFQQAGLNIQGYQSGNYASKRLHAFGGGIFW